MLDASSSKNNFEKILFLPASNDKDKQKTVKSIQFCKGAQIPAFFEVNIHDLRQIFELLT